MELPRDAKQFASSVQVDEIFCISNEELSAFIKAITFY